MIEVPGAHHGAADQRRIDLCLHAHLAVEALLERRDELRAARHRAIGAAEVIVTSTMRSASSFSSSKSCAISGRNRQALVLGQHAR